MAHFAKVIDGIVTQVIVADQSFIDNLDDSALWVQTSYNTHGGVHSGGGTPMRKNYAGIGMTYDATRDAFYDPQQPYPSWSLNDDSCLWEAPTAYPDDGLIYGWDEESTSWVQV
tara:strand:- start:120 stop:461 length:342 start_codon:yes stop_codon:yes gene_type:complete